jgi:hypothetical protein
MNIIATHPREGENQDPFKGIFSGINLPIAPPAAMLMSQCAAAINTASTH